MTRLPVATVLLLAACASSPPRATSSVATPVAAVSPADDEIAVQEPADDDDGDDEEPSDRELPPEENQPPARQPRPPHPFANLTDAELEARLESDPDSLGPISIGRTSSGALVGGLPMPTGARWKIVNPPQTFGTQETIDQLIRCIDAVNDRFPDTQPVYVGDISDRNGGYLVPHISHQSGRDVDVGYYYATEHQWYVTANSSNLDLPRTWTFVRAMITETDVEAIFIDRSIQKLLRDYATGIGEDAGWLDEVFGGPSSSRRPLIMHAKGHKSHIHVRFYNPIAQETGRRLYQALVKRKKIRPPTYFIKHKVRRGETLSRLAKRYKTTVKAIKKANRLRSTMIIANRTYKIPRKGGVRPAPGPIVIPDRRLPPSDPRPPPGEPQVAGESPPPAAD